MDKKMRPASEISARSLASMEGYLMPVTHANELTYL